MDAERYLGMRGAKEFVSIGYIGGLKPGKNVEALIESFSRFLNNYPEANAKLVIIGDGPMKCILKDSVKKHNISADVFFFGFIPDAYRFLEAIDIFVLPSLSEGSPFSLIEAMAAGKAIIASDISGIREIVRNGEEAILIDPYSVEELKQAISLLYNNPNLRAKLGQSAKEKAKLYDVDRVYGRILKLYEELVRCKAK